MSLRSLCGTQMDTQNSQSFFFLFLFRFNKFKILLHDIRIATTEMFRYIFSVWYIYMEGS